MDSARGLKWKGINTDLFDGGEDAEAEVLLDPVGSEDEGGCKEGGLRDVTGHIGTLHHSLLARHTLDQGVGEPAYNSSYY